MYKECFHIRILNNILEEWLQSDPNNHLHKHSSSLSYHMGPHLRLGNSDTFEKEFKNLIRNHRKQLRLR